MNNVISSILPIHQDVGALLSADTPTGSADDSDVEEFNALINSPIGTSENESIFDIVDRSKSTLQHSLELTAAHPTAKNMFEATRHLSKFDLQTLVIGKVVDKATKGIDRMLNMQ
ncbi:MAG: Type secretion basal body protein YscI, HrpB, PscI [Rhizobacter sp.]|nr:Type secretion basal body protein YscI, HrpB, PscI [Rhizobacter sp.]